MEDISLILPVVGIAAATAIEFCPTIFAVCLRIYIGFCKALFHGQIKASIQNASHFPLLIPYKLMAGINVAFWGNCYILITTATSPQAFNGTRSLIQVDHKMEKVKPFPLFPAL